MLDAGLVEALRRSLGGQGRLVHLPADKDVVFVGDTHGDRQATERVLARFLSPQRVVVFLGDYVDRGPDSAGNLQLLLETKLDRPDQLHLLMGNHEGWSVCPFSPADFWQGLGRREGRAIGELLSLLPLVAYHPGGVLGLHGALPDVRSVDEIDSIPLGSADWRKITWGDWADVPEYVVDPGALGRPTFGRAYFDDVMARLSLRALVRSHQPFAPAYLFSGRCLTIFTSVAYGGTDRRVALLPAASRVSSAADLTVIDL
ncbi:MAG: metallophosphoesterase family protein [Candidatus Bipolaricaulaceae bacterium]